MSRELDVRADELRAWARHARERTGSEGAYPARAWSRRIDGSGANWRSRAKSKRSQERWPRTSRKSRDEVRIRSMPATLPGPDTVKLTPTASVTRQH